MRLSESLNYHMKEGEMLKKVKEKLEEENEKLKGDKELNEMMVQEKVVQTKNQKQQIRTVSFFLYQWILLSGLISYSMALSVHVILL